MHFKEQCSFWTLIIIIFNYDGGAAPMEESWKEKYVFSLIHIGRKGMPSPGGSRGAAAMKEMSNILTKGDTY